MSNIGTVASVRASARWTRLSTVALAVLAPLALWALAESAFGLDLRSPAFGDAESSDIGAGNVIFAALIGSVAAWAALALLERVTVHAPRIWATGALVVLLVSLGGPLGGTDIEGAGRAVLAAMHVLVAGILIVGLYRSAVERAPRTGAASTRRQQRQPERQPA